MLPLNFIGIYLTALLINDAFRFGATDTGTLKELPLGDTLGLYISSVDVIDNILQKLLNLDEKMAQLDVKLKNQAEIMQQQKDNKRHMERIESKLEIFKNDFVKCSSQASMQQAIEHFKNEIDGSTKTSEVAMQKLSREIKMDTKQHIEAVEKRLVNLKTELISSLRDMKQTQTNANGKIEQQKDEKIEAVSSLSTIAPRNCAELNITRNGRYQLNVPTKRGDVLSFFAYCMLDPEDNCTRTVVTRTLNEADFAGRRSNGEYEEGFGSMNGTFFIGLAKLKVLTNEQAYAFYGMKNSEIVKECVQLLIGNENFYNYKCTWELKTVVHPSKSTWIDEISALASYDLAYIKPKKCLEE